ncbi:MAG: hypothetical protein IKK72_00565 [Oscillospiraceae bacterium]|nr:hypothetical protein [Oscillospiraceae bacterium]
MKDLIYCQSNIPKDQWRYGFRSSAATGCGWIATYNALRLMGYRAEPERLIKRYERMLPLIHGNTGTTIPAPALAFKRWGFPVKVVCRRKQFDEAAKESDVCIVFYYWRGRWKLGAHFATVQYKDGRFTGYNTYTNSTGPDDWTESIEGFLKQRKYFASLLICIQDKRK